MRGITITSSYLWSDQPLCLAAAARVLVGVRLAKGETLERENVAGQPELPLQQLHTKRDVSLVSDGSPSAAPAHLRVLWEILMVQFDFYIVLVAHNNSALFLVNSRAG